jgi:hypothetical protein
MTALLIFAVRKVQYSFKCGGWIFRRFC